MEGQQSSSSSTSEILELLQGSYKETLDATKHQDDKIGRLFTGVSFLTAAALATANLGGSRYLSHEYSEFSGAPAGVFLLASYLILVVVCVMLLINSLATPLRVPGLTRRRPDGPNHTSQIYFGEIAKVGIEEWDRTWLKPPTDLKRELVQSLVGETHNLAVRTQFKYGRTTEAITVFNLALLFLSLTVAYCASAATSLSSGSDHLSDWSRWVIAGAFGLFFFVQLQGQARYSRQTVDELVGADNRRQGWIRYVLAVCGTAWIIVLASGVAAHSLSGVLVFLPVLAGGAALILGTEDFAKDETKVPKLAWFGTLSAIGTAFTLTAIVVRGSEYLASFVAAVTACVLLTSFSLLLPSLALRRSRVKFETRKKLVEALQEKQKDRT